MSKPLTSGIYRVRQDVCGPRGLARVERVPDPEGFNERYTVRFYAKEAPTGELVATCWRWGQSAPSVTIAPDKRPAPHYDGGWTRALAIAEDITLGSADHSATDYSSSRE